MGKGIDTQMARKAGDWDKTAFQRHFLEDLFARTIARLQPADLLARRWPAITARLPALTASPPAPTARSLIIGYGKAAAALAAAVVARLPPPVTGLVSVPKGYAHPWRSLLSNAGVSIVIAGHPLPDDNSLRAAHRALSLLQTASPQDHVLFLATGGGSATLAAPLPPLTLADKRDILNHLLLAGAPIEDINLVRRHLSAVKGGRLATAARKARLQVTFVISDVVGDDPALVASGPSIPARHDPNAAHAVLDRHQAPHRRKWEAVLADSTMPGKVPDADSPNPVFLLATGTDLLQAAAMTARPAGLDVIDLTDRITGDAEETGRAHAGLAKRLLATCTRPTLVLSGGELTVRVRHEAGRGGPNLTYLAAMLQELRGEQGIAALAADTDGRDGSSGHAGGVITAQSWQKLQERGMSVRTFLENNETLRLFQHLDGLLKTGPIPLNVNDFRAILVVPHHD